MRRRKWPISQPRRNPQHYRFALPNAVWEYKLKPVEFVIFSYLCYYRYLLLIEHRRTHTCHPSYNTIATATGLSKNTAIKSVSTLLEMGLITVESSSYFDKCGMKWKSNNLYTILPVRLAVDVFYQEQLRQVGLGTERQITQARLSRLCAPQKSLPTVGRPVTPPAL